MLNAIIRFALRQRMLTLSLATCVLLLGIWQIVSLFFWQIWLLPIDVFPDLTRPRVTLLTDAPGMAPEEVETLITIPLETSLNGANGVQTVRTVSGVGMSVV